MLSCCNRAWSLLKTRFNLPESRFHLRKEALRELEQRAFFGSFIYPACWLGISLGAGTAGDPIVWAVLALLLALMLVRVLVHIYFGRMLSTGDRIPRAFFAGTVLTTALTYGVATLLTLRLGTLQEMQYPMIVSCGVICTTATMILAIDPILRFGIPVAMLVPLAAGLAFDESHAQMTLTILLIVNVGYLIVGSRDTHRDYWEAVRVKENLRQQAAASEIASRTDPLTGIPNRLSFDKAAIHAWQSFREKGCLFSIVLMDVDHFKRVNDAHGHAAGDQCLSAVAQALRSVMQREGDLVARFGGEEFIALLSDSSRSAAMQTAELFRLAVSGLEVTVQGQILPLTCSVGVATVWASSESMEEVVRNADAALYLAKSAGRNRVQEAAPQASD